MIIISYLFKKFINNPTFFEVPGVSRDPHMCTKYTCVSHELESKISRHFFCPEKVIKENKKILNDFYVNYNKPLKLS